VGSAHTRRAEGHALEVVTNYETWLHGEAVAIGMEVAAHIAVATGTLSQEEATRQTRLLKALNLPVRCPGVDVDLLLHRMQQDKKVSAGSIRWVYQPVLDTLASMTISILW
jgi:3-dehydroquinate synthetase